MEVLSPGLDASRTVTIEERRARVLLVDDDRDLRAVMAEWLEGKGYEILQAADGQHALALLSEGVEPDVIVLDLAMPVMDGWAFLARLRADPRHRHRRVLVTSSEPQERAPAEADGCVTKPFVPEQFSRALSRLAASDA